MVAVLLTGLLVLAALVTHTAAVPRWDTDVVRWIAEHRSPTTVEIARIATLFGHFLWLMGAMVVAGVLLRRGYVAGAWLPLAALLVVGAVDPLVKSLVDRPRPPTEFWAAFERSSGYPSSHSAQAAAAWLTLALIVGARWPRRARAALLRALAIVVAVGASRVTLGVHSPTDVFGGWALGAIVALCTVASWHGRTGIRTRR